MSKMFTAIEMVFMIFIMIVVVLVVIQLVMQNVNPSRISPYIQNIQELAKKNYIDQFCNNLCSAVKTATNEGERLRAMVRWCSDKITDRGKNYIDIVEDSTPGFYVISGYPYCEDGTYCFHFSTCDAGIVLDMRECRRILCEYFYSMGEDVEGATDNVKNLITPGRCKITSSKPQNYVLLAPSPSWWYDRFFGDEFDCEEYLEELE